MRTGQVARQSGVNTQTLRYYERRGLLQVPPRRPSGYREYAPDAVGIIRFVKRAQELGFSLTEVESLLNLAAGGPANCDRARGLATEKLAELKGKIASLRGDAGLATETGRDLREAATPKGMPARAPSRWMPPVRPTTAR